MGFDLAGGGTRKVLISRPQIVANSGNDFSKAYMIFRDRERGNRVSVAICDDLTSPAWTIKDLNDTSLGCWEPTCDTALWSRDKSLHLFIQEVEQITGEGIEETYPPQPIYILEWTPR